MGIFGKKPPGSDTEDEPYKPRRDYKVEGSSRPPMGKEPLPSTGQQVNLPPKSSVPTTPPQKAAPAMPNVTSAPIPELTLNLPTKEAAPVVEAPVGAPAATQTPSPSPSPAVTQAPSPAVTQTPSPAATQAPVPSPVSTPMPTQETKKVNYSIEDVIRLMRELPDSKKEMVVIIVQKTLVSAKIDINNIIEDAGRKTDKLQKSNDKLVAEIRELEEAIILKKGEVDKLARDIEETSSVKSIFESVYARHVKEEMEAKERERQPTAPPVPGSGTGNAGGF